MTWLRYDDRFTSAPCWDDVTHAARWHYLALVEACGATGRYDGALPVTLARRVSDVPDPDEALEQLAAAGRVTVEGTTVRVLTITEHVPPPSIRENAERSRERMRRKRAHDAGDHSTCLPDHCDQAPHPVTGEVTPPVTRNTGTGRDGTGRVTPSAGTTKGREHDEAVTRDVTHDEQGPHDEHDQAGEVEQHDQAEQAPTCGWCDATTARMERDGRPMLYGSRPWCGWCEPVEEGAA